MERDRDVVVALLRVAREPDVAPALPGLLLTQLPETADEFGRVEVARDPHAASTSSRTKCNRITPGRSASSK